MSFKIGFDLGVVLAKGVFISMITGLKMNASRQQIQKNITTMSQENLISFSQNMVMSEKDTTTESKKQTTNHLPLHRDSANATIIKKKDTIK